MTWLMGLLGTTKCAVCGHAKYVHWGGWARCSLCKCEKFQEPVK